MKTRVIQHHSKNIWSNLHHNVFPASNWCTKYILYC